MKSGIKVRPCHVLRRVSCEASVLFDWAPRRNVYRFPPPELDMAFVSKHW